MANNRVVWIDNVKGFGILMIMLAHVIQNFPEYNPLNTYVCSFHVPIFFIISGYVAALAHKDKITKKRVKALLIPYVIFSCFNSAIKFAVLGITHALSVDIIQKELVELLITGNGTVWFLVTLLLTEVVYIYLLRKINNKTIQAIISVVLIICAFILPDATNPLLVVIYRVICATGYYGLGYATSELTDNKLIISAMLISGFVIEKVFGCGIDFFNGSFTKPIPSIVASILTSYGFILLIRLWDVKASEKIGKSQKSEELAGEQKKSVLRGIVNYMGSNSIIVMLVHPIVLMVILYPLGNLLRSFSGHMAYIIGAVLYLVLCALQVPCIWIINNYMPFLIAKNKR